MSEQEDHTIAVYKAEVARLNKWVIDLQSGFYVNCVYCGHRYGPNHSTKRAMADVLKDHIENCVHHPLSKLKLEFAELLKENVSLRMKLNFEDLSYANKKEV